MTSYSIVHYLIMPLVLFRLFWRGLDAPAYRERWPERFGFGKPLPPGESRIWVHAVSVGEVQAAVPIVHALRARYPKAAILVTTTTPTGAARVAGALGTVEHRYVPYDLPGCVRRFLDRADPSLAVILETELWPNLLAACRGRSIPVLLVNARLSARSARGYGRVARTTRGMLTSLSAIAAQGHHDARRLIALGADPRGVEVTGSVKFDIELHPGTRQAGRTMRKYWGVDRLVWIAASTHEGEEEQVLDAFRWLRESVPEALLILVPRHPERFARVDALVRRRGYDAVLRSRLANTDTAPPADFRIDADVIIGDTMGELPVLYAASDVAFVGGSLVPVGGHNMLEPAALGIPVLFGPHVFNFKEIAENLCRCGGAVQVWDNRELSERLATLLRDAHARHDMGKKAEVFVRENRGALDRIMALVGTLYHAGGSKRETGE
uniref:3-deoxy-D-manno-octulosonic acid transferase n=1 Tax=Candidatus Kentrum sp. LFY TaxID=2126342 RepID=A0A450UXV4_9GAMM|nr:MAG: 3-deoxy-D-manno-octulosonic-acid transferase [Candidatus Kentron sp. LFY]